jgi:hypothetical protein
LKYQKDALENEEISKKDEIELDPDGPKVKKGKYTFSEY